VLAAETSGEDGVDSPSTTVTTSNATHDGSGESSPSKGTGRYPTPDETPPVSPRTPHISLADFTQYLESEAGQEFELCDTDESREEAEERWEAVIDFEWERCVREEIAWDSMCPFVLCHYRGEMSGYQRIESLGKAVAEASAEREYSEKYVLNNAKTAYSVDGLWCGYARIHASVAERIERGTDLGISVTPVVMQMKMVPDTVRRMLQVTRYLNGDNTSELVRRGRLLLARMEGHNLDDDVYDAQLVRMLEADGGSDNDLWKLLTADIYLCPGYLEEIVGQPEEDLIQSVVDQGLDPDDLDVTAKVTEFLLKKQTDFQGPDLKTFLQHNIFWTSPASKVLRESSGDRGNFWKGIFEHGLDDRCGIIWSTKLQFQASFNAPPDMSLLTMTYDRENAEEADDWCAFSLLAAIAAHTGVCSVSFQPEMKMGNSKESMIVQSGVPDRRPWFDGGLDGSGQVVAVSDTGIDMNNCYFSDGDGVKPVKVVDYVGYADNLDTDQGHGTHVAATVAGRLDPNDNAKVHEADGIARSAKIAFIDLGYPDESLMIPGIPRLMSTGRRMLDQDQPKAHIHSASWGSANIQNAYTSQAGSFDQYMYKNDDFLIIAAAGNSGAEGMNSVSAPATFKNGISVGASNTYKGGGNSMGPAYLWATSSRGPTADGRLKPEVVAPGRNIVSAKVNLDSAGKCHSSTKEMSGTSMATPIVSGTAALIRQYFEDGWYPHGKKGSGPTMSPSGAMVKAILLNGAQTNMKGVDEGTTTLGQRITSSVKAYDNNIGFGRIDLSYSLYLEGSSEVQAEIWDRQFVAEGKPLTFTVSIDRSKGCAFKDLSATLVWVEKSSLQGCTSCVNNDLDLHVTEKGGDGTKFYPNGLDVKDSRNNAERVVVPNVADGKSYTLHVRAANLADSFEHKFALVATGCFGGKANSITKSKDVFNKDDSGSKLSRIMIVVIVCCSITATIILSCVCWSCFKRGRQNKST